MANPPPTELQEPSCYYNMNRFKFLERNERNALQWHSIL